MCGLALGRRGRRERVADLDIVAGAGAVVGKLTGQLAQAELIGRSGGDVGRGLLALLVVGLHSRVPVLAGRRHGVEGLARVAHEVTGDLGAAEGRQGRLHHAVDGQVEPAHQLRVEIVEVGLGEGHRVAVGVARGLVEELVDLALLVLQAVPPGVDLVDVGLVGRGHLGRQGADLAHGRVVRDLEVGQGALGVLVLAHQVVDARHGATVITVRRERHAAGEGHHQGEQAHDQAGPDRRAGHGFLLVCFSGHCRTSMLNMGGLKISATATIGATTTTGGLATTTAATAASSTATTTTTTRIGALCEPFKDSEDDLTFNLEEDP